MITQKRKLAWLGVVLGILLWPLGTGIAQEAANLIINHASAREQEEFVTVDVYFTMTDGNGRPLPNPNIDAATIQLLDGSSEPVGAIVEDPATPIYITLIIDASGSMSGVIDEVKAAAQTAIDRAPPNAFFSVMQFNESWQILEDFTNDPARIKAAIARVTVENRGTCLYDATYEGIDQLARQIQSPQERRAIILFTDGQDQLTQDNPEPCSVYTYQDVINHARPTSSTPGTPIHTIGLSDGSLNNINAPELRSMAAETTAFSAIGGTDRLDSLFEDIMAGLNSQLVARASLFAAEGNNRAVLSVALRNQSLPLDSTFNFFSSRTYNAPPPPAKTNIGSVQYDQQQDLYRLSLGIANPESVSQIVVQVWDTRGGVQVSRDYIFPNPPATLIIELDTEGFEPEGEYTIRVQGTDQDGFLIEDDEGNTMLAEAEVRYSPRQARPVPFTIQSINALYETSELIIDLDVPETDRVQSYDGFIVDEDTGERIHDFGPTPFSGPRLQEALPAAIAEAETAGTYRVTVHLNTTEALRSEAVYDDFSPIPPEPPGLFARIAAGLGSNPVLLGSILVIIFAIVGWFMVRSRTTATGATPLPRPPIDRTQVYDASDIRAGSGGAYGTEAPWPGEEEVAVPTIPRLHLRIMKSPAPQPEMETFIQQYPYLIGREDCDLNIGGDMRISRRHLRITEQNGTVYLTDLNSSNGTYLDGQKLDPNIPTPLPSVAQQVYLGSQTLLEFELG